MTSCLLIRRIYFQIVTSLLSGSRDCLFELARISKIFGCLQRNASAAKISGCLQRLFYLAVQTKLVLSLTRSWSWQNSILCPGSIEWLPCVGDLSLSLDGWCPKAGPWGKLVLSEKPQYDVFWLMSNSGPWGKLGLSEKPQCDVFWLMTNSGPWLMTMDSLQSLGRGWTRYCVHADVIVVDILVKLFVFHEEKPVEQLGEIIEGSTEADVV